MKLIWAKDKLKGLDLNKLKNSNLRADNRPSGFSLARRKASNYRAELRSSAQNLPKNKGSIQNCVQINLDELMTAEPSQSVLTRPTCKVCGQPQETTLKSLNETADGVPYNKMLYETFGIQIHDPNFKVCEKCAQTIQHVHKFMKVVYAAAAIGVPPVSESSSETCIAEYDSIDDLINPLKSQTKENRPQRPLAKKRPPLFTPKPKKIFVECTVCHQKYPMITKQGTPYVCSRCKISHINDRTMACVKCKAVVPANNMKKHLELHANTDLKGRCRLRTLPKKPSKVKTADSIPKKPRPPQKQRKPCPKRFTKSQSLTENMKSRHVDVGYGIPYKCTVCGKDMRCMDSLEKHYKMHDRATTYECPVCGKIFKKRCAFQRHHEIHQSLRASEHQSCVNVSFIKKK